MNNGKKATSGSSELVFLRELVLRQTSVIESLTAKMSEKSPTYDIPKPDPLPEDVSKAIAEVTEPGSVLARQLERRAVTLMHGGATLDTITASILKGETPEV